MRRKVYRACLPLPYNYEYEGACVCLLWHCSLNLARVKALAMKQYG